MKNWTKLFHIELAPCVLCIELLWFQYVIGRCIFIVLRFFFVGKKFMVPTYPKKIFPNVSNLFCVWEAPPLRPQFLLDLCPPPGVPFPDPRCFGIETQSNLFSVITGYSFWIFLMLKFKIFCGKTIFCSEFYETRNKIRFRTFQGKKFAIKFFFILMFIGFFSSKIWM